jgi:hypothetical protein
MTAGTKSNPRPATIAMFTQLRGWLPSCRAWTAGAWGFGFAATGFGSVEGLNVGRCAAGFWRLTTAWLGTARCVTVVDFAAGSLVCTTVTVVTCGRLTGFTTTGATTWGWRFGTV